MPSAVTKLKLALGLENREPDPLSSDSEFGELSMSRLVWGNKDSRLAIRKTFTTSVDGDGSFLIPAEVREDSTGRTHLTNEVEKGTTYKIGLLLAEPSRPRIHTFKKYYTVKFNGYVTKKGRITIPKEIREAYEITPNMTVAVSVQSKQFDPAYENRSYLPSTRTLPDRENLDAYLG